MGVMSSKDKTQSMAEVKKYIDTLLANKKVLVISKSWCIYCKKARKAFDSFTLKEGAMEWIDIDKRDDGSAIQDYMEELTGKRSVPRVFIGGQFFGGGDDTHAAKQSGLLEQKLKEVGAI